MSFKREYTQIIITFLVWLFYVAFFENKTVMFLLGIFAFGLTLYIFVRISDMLNKDRERSVHTLQTKLNKSEKENEEAYKKFLSLSKTLGSGVFMVDEDGLITFSNKDMENYFGMDISNKDYRELVDMKPLYKFVDQAYLSEEYYRKQIKLEDKIYDLISTPILEGDMFAGCLVLVNDITLIKATEKFQKRFTADVSHELRTPLSAIIGYSEILQRADEMKDEDRKEFLDTINSEANKMEIVLNDLLVISRLDRIDYEMDIQLHDISEIISANAKLLESRFKEKSLTSSIDTEPCEMKLDRVKISQVLLNVIRNGINYTDKGFVNISGEVQGNQYIIKISDSGIGIPQDKLENIFTRFYRVDKARSRDTGGSGLGLSISKNIVIKHNGKIEVYSEEGKGSTFVITLPIKK